MLRRAFTLAWQGNEYFLTPTLNLPVSVETTVSKWLAAKATQSQALLQAREENPASHDNTSLAHEIWTQCVSLYKLVVVVVDDDDVLCQECLVLFGVGLVGLLASGMQWLIIDMSDTATTFM